MKLRSSLLLMFSGVLSTASIEAQTLGPQLAAGSAPSVAPEVVSSATGVNSPTGRLTSEQLDQLLAPIALYPDALIALILPSATASSDVVLAARYLAGEGNAPAEIESQGWDDSVKALAHYPSLVKWMDQNLAWTKQVGEVFLEQPAEVMKSIQRLRAAARAAGTLVDTPEQQIVADAETISIVPAQSDMIYVPYYDPQIVYVRRPNYSSYSGSAFFSFSTGYPVGFWLGYNMDWRHRRIWMVERHQRERYWSEQNDWRRPSFPSEAGRGPDAIRRPWTPNPISQRPPSQPVVRRAGTVIVRPTPITLESNAQTSVASWSTPDRVDRTSRNREEPSASDSSRGQRGSRTRPQNSQVSNSSSSPQVQSTASVPSSTFAAGSAAEPAPTQPTTYNRGSRMPQENSRSEARTSETRRPDREPRSRPEPSVRSESSPAVRSAPAAAPVLAAPVQVAAPSQSSAPSVSRSDPAPASPSTNSDSGASSGQRSYSRGR